MNGGSPLQVCSHAGVQTKQTEQYSIIVFVLHATHIQFNVKRSLDSHDVIVVSVTEMVM